MRRLVPRRGRLVVVILVGAVRVVVVVVVLAGTRSRARGVPVVRLVRVRLGARARPGFHLCLFLARTLGRRRDLPDGRRQRVALDRAARARGRIARVAPAARRPLSRRARDRDRAVGGPFARAPELASERGEALAAGPQRRSVSFCRRVARDAWSDLVEHDPPARLDPILKKTLLLVHHSRRPEGAPPLDVAGVRGAESRGDALTHVVDAQRVGVPNERVRRRGVLFDDALGRLGRLGRAARALGASGGAQRRGAR